MLCNLLYEYHSNLINYLIPVGNDINSRRLLFNDDQDYLTHSVRDLMGCDVFYSESRHNFCFNKYNFCLVPTLCESQVVFRYHCNACCHLGLLLQAGYIKLKRSKSKIQCLRLFCYAYYIFRWQPELNSIDGVHRRFTHLVVSYFDAFMTKSFY